MTGNTQLRVKKKKRKKTKMRISKQINTSKSCHGTAASFSSILPTSISAIPRFFSPGFLSYFTLLALVFHVYASALSSVLLSSSPLLLSPSLLLTDSSPLSSPSFLSFRISVEKKGRGRETCKKGATRVLQVKRGLSMRNRLSQCVKHS